MLSTNTLKHAGALVPQALLAVAQTAPPIVPFQRTVMESVVWPEVMVAFGGTDQVYEFALATGVSQKTSVWLGQSVSLPLMTGTAGKV